MIPEVATVLARQLQRDLFAGRDDFAFPNEVGRYLDGSASDTATRPLRRPRTYARSGSMISATASARSPSRRPCLRRLAQCCSYVKGGSFFNVV